MLSSTSWLTLSLVILSLVSVSSVMIREFPVNITTLEGGEAKFTCKVGEQGISEYVFWKKVGNAGFADVLSYDNVSMNVSKYSVHNAYELTVRHVTLSDEAEYECQAGDDRARVSLTVAVLMENMTMSWSSMPPYEPRSKVNLTCHVIHSRPPADIRWYRGNEELTRLATTCESTINQNGFGDACSVLGVFVSGQARIFPYRCVASLPGVSISRTEIAYPIVAGALTSSTSSPYSKVLVASLILLLWPDL